MKKLKLAFAVLLCLLVVVQAVAADWSGDDPSDNGVPPQYLEPADLGGPPWPSNEECQALGYVYGFKIDAEDLPSYPDPQEYPLDESSGGELKPPGTTPPDESVTILNNTGTYFDWNSTFNVLAVIVKAGNGGNLYNYGTEGSDGDGNLHSPFSGDSSEDPGTAREISHITFCWDEITAVTGPGSSFNAQASAGGRVALTWETDAELDNAGFNLYRAMLKDGLYTQINEALIAAQGDAVSGASYSFLDRPYYGTFYYKLEDVNLYGVSTLHGPVKVTVARRPLRRPLYRPNLPEF